MQVSILRRDNLPGQRLELTFATDKDLVDGLVQQILNPLTVPFDSPVLPGAVGVGGAVGGAGLLEPPGEVARELAATVRDELLRRAEEAEPSGRVASPRALGGEVSAHVCCDLVVGAMVEDVQESAKVAP